MKREENVQKKAGYTERLVTHVLDAFLIAVSEEEPELSRFIVELRDVWKIEKRHRRMELYKVMHQQFLELYDEKKFSKKYYLLHEYLAKMADISRIARKIAAAIILKTHAQKGDYSIDRYEFAFDSFTTLTPDNHLCVRRSELQNLIDHYASVHLSVTAHPTNPTSVDFVRAAIEVDRLLAAEEGSSEQLLDALRAVAKVPLIGPKKSIQDEVHETLAVFDQVYDAVPDVYYELSTTLTKYDYNEVNIPRKLVYFSMWASGDGDGNENATAEALHRAIETNRNYINTRYLFDLDVLRETLIQAKESLPCIKLLQNIIHYISVNNNKNINYNINYILSQIDELIVIVEDEKCRVMIREFSMRLMTFADVGPKIDIRHNAEDTMITLAVLLENMGLLTIAENEDNVEEFFREKQALVLTLFDDERFVTRVNGVRKSASLYSANDKWQEIANRVFSRLKVIAENDGVSEKFIIAEASSAMHGLGALLLIKLAGVNVKKRPYIDIVPLFESRADLENAKAIMQELLSVDIFYRYVQKRGVLKPMIAKSDTQRRSGSAVKAIQEKAIAELHTLQEEYGVPVSIFHGGGIELQRGGGRVTELSRITAEALMDVDVESMGVPDTTIQGHQGRLFFASVDGVKNFAGFSMAQQLYHGALLANYIPPSCVSEHANEEQILCIADAEQLFFSTVIGAYEKRWYNHSAIIELAKVSFPWIAVKVSNVSSRASMRGGDSAAGGKATFAQLMGYREGDKSYNDSIENPFAQRAITFDRLMAHSGTSASFILGLCEGFDVVKKDSPDDYAQRLHSVYGSSKVFRDVIRNTAIILTIMDFDHAWSLLGKQRPTKKERIELAQRFTDDNRDNRVTLAAIENMAYLVEKNVYLTLNGESSKNEKLGGALESTWPELYEQMELRARQVEFSKMELARITHHINQNPEEEITESMQELLRVCYVGADVGFNTPSGVGLTQTDKQRDVPTMFSERNIDDIIALPSVLKSNEIK